MDVNNYVNFLFGKSQSYFELLVLHSWLLKNKNYETLLITLIANQKNNMDKMQV